MTSRDPRRLLYLSPVPLASFAQRPHHFVHWFRQRFGAEVLWIDPGPSRLPRSSDWTRLLKHFQAPGPALGPDWRHESWLQHFSVKVLPFEPYNWGRCINRILWRDVLKLADAFVTPETVLVLGKPCALSLALAQRYPQSRSIFDAMDHMPGFCVGASRRWMIEVERSLAMRVDTIWTSSHALAEHYSAHAAKVSVVLNALSRPPKASKLLKSQRPVLGYLGVIDRWFDWSLIMQLAQTYREARIELVGPIHIPSPQSLPPNVHCLPPVPQHQVYQAMASFDIGLIPFASNDVTAYVDPVKYYEYRALGLPVLSTRFGEMSRRSAIDGVYFWDQLVNGATSLETVIADRSDERHRQAFCDLNNWTNRFEAVASSLCQTSPR